jgi:RNA polymerase sigma factor (sigma-70 family)
VSAVLTLPAAAVVELEAVIPPPSARPLDGSADGASLPVVNDWTIPQLTAGVRRGDEAAVRALHARYCERLTRYALVIARGDEAAAAEAVQTAFLKSLRHLRPLPDESALWAWLARAARTAAADAGRRSHRYRALLGRVAALFSREEERALDDTEAVWLAALECALTKLDQDSRALIEARYFQRRPLADVAAEQSSTGRAIEGRLARIREKLRRSILQQLASSRHEP